MDWRVVHGQMNDDLASLLARKQMQQNFMMRIAADERDRADISRRHGLDTQRLRLDEDVRRQNADSLKFSREQAVEARQRSDENTRRQRFTDGTVKMLPKGSILRRGQHDATLKEFEEFAPGLVSKHGADDHGADEHFEFGGTQDAAEAAAALEQRTREAELRAEVAAGRMSVAQANSELTRLRDEFNRSKPGSIQYYHKLDGTMGAFQPMPDGSTREVPLPAGFKGTGNPQKTPDQIKAEAQARAEGTAAGKGSGGGVFDFIQSLRGVKTEKPDFVNGPPAPTATTPQVGERRTFNGQLAEWDGRGWKPVQQ
jgi:multidrug efflux pump subunit AcrA (membrane-fusion protein)